MLSVVRSLPGYGALRKLLRRDETTRDFLLRAMPKRSICAEIGVDRGEFAQRILDVARPRRLHLIDPWKYEEGEVYREARYGGNRGESQDSMDQRYSAVLGRFRREIEAGRVVVHRGYSQEICEGFDDDYFDWVYIDGNHLYDYVKRDLRSYCDKVKDGGHITGDDYSEEGWWRDGVKKAVDEFSETGEVSLVLIKNSQFILRKNGHAIQSRELP